MSCNGILTPSTEDVYPDLEDIREFIHNLHVAHALATTLHEYYPDDEHIAVILLICEDMLENADERELATRTIDEFLVPCLARSRELVQVLDELTIQKAEEDADFAHFLSQRQ